MNEHALRKMLERALEAQRNARYDQAAGLYEKVLARHPRNRQALQYLALLKQQTGDPEGGAATLRRALALDESDAVGWNNLGGMLRELGRREEAVQAYRNALRVIPDYQNALYNLGTTLQDDGEWMESARIFRRLLAQAPDDAQSWLALGTALRELGALDEAEDAARRAIGLDPSFAMAHNNLGALALGANRFDEAHGSFMRALAIDPGLVEAHNNLGNLLEFHGEISRAIEHYRHAVRLRPSFAIAHNNLATALKVTGDFDDALKHYRRALEIDPGFRGARSNFLYCLNYVPDIANETVAAEHRIWNLMHGLGPIGAGEAFDNSINTERILRIGYVSADLRAHSVAFFVEPLLRSHSREVVRVYCYSSLRQADSVTERLRGMADAWCEATQLSDIELAARIRQDGIDVLVDLSGHTAGNRLAVFAMKPAPVQVTYIGYPNTTGLESIDYRITDSWCDPDDDPSNWHSEKLVRLPGGFLCFQPPDYAPPVTAAPYHAKNCITFGSFNNLTKVTAQVIDLWSEVLRAVEGSRIVLKAHQLRDPELRTRCLARFTACGVDASRVTLLPPITSLRDHLGAYAEIDIALDTFPYNGTTTTCEAMWMGVPVITLAGGCHRARVGSSLLNQVGFADLVARDATHFVAIARGLAGDRARIEGLRGELNAAMRRSRLLDSERQCADIERAYRDMWIHWCERQRRAR